MNSRTLVTKIIAQARERGDMSPGDDDLKFYLRNKEINLLNENDIKSVTSSDGKLRWMFVGDAIIQRSTKIYKWDTWPVPKRVKICERAGLLGQSGSKSWAGLGRANRDSIRTFLKAKRENKIAPALKTAKPKKHKKSKK